MGAMSETIRFFQDVLTIDQDLITMLNPQADDTIVLGGRIVTLSGVLPKYNYVIAADELTVLSNVATPPFDDPGPVITVLAGSIKGVLAAASQGFPGAASAEPKTEVQTSSASVGTKSNTG